MVKLQGTAHKFMSTLNSNTLLHTKLMPPRLPSALVQRDEMLARLDLSLTKKVALVTAPTGFGKTTLVRTWIESRDFLSAWVTLDHHDNDPVRFWTYVCSALRTLGPNLGKATLSMLTSPQPPSFAPLLTPLINDLLRWETPSVLVLEDYHVIESPEINEGISFLIQHLPARLHLVFLTRTEPDLSLGILRARDELVEIHASDLRFTQKETEDFLYSVTQANFPPAVVNKLWQKTEGWPAGLRLGVLALQNKGGIADVETLIDSFSGSDRFVADYFIKEVFESQPPALQSFLMKTSFFKELTGSLCDAVLGTTHSAATLEQLERGDLFLVQLERGGRQVWYRYNALFAETLRYLARQRLEDVEIKRVFENASGWYEYQGLFDEAIETALAAELFGRTMALMERFIEIHDLSEMQTISRWLEHIPQQELLRHPTICFTYAQVILYSSDRFAPLTAARIEPFLQAAESVWQANEDDRRLGQLLSFRGNVAWWQGEFQKAFDYSRQSLDMLPEQDAFWRGNSLLSMCYEALSTGRIGEAQDKALEARALLGAAQNVFGVLAATQFLAEIFYWKGELEQAEQLNRQIQTEAVGPESMLDDQGVASLNLAHIAYERNELGQAEAFARQALDLSRQRANELLEVQATVRLAHVHSARGDSSRAHEILKSLEAKIQKPGLLREIQNTQALLSIRANDTSLEWWVKLVSAEGPGGLHLQKEFEAFTLARLRLAEGKASEALNLLKPRREDAVQHGRVRSQVEAFCLEALAYYADANLREAERPLNEALVIGQLKGFRRMFLDEGPRMAALLQAIVPSLPNRSLSLFAGVLLQSFSPEITSRGGANSSTFQFEALSQQELRVLRLLVAGLSNADVARELIVSTNTVKSHVKSIYRKLNVSSRDEARQAARELKLI
jgi:LuxR family maltose regulon positive regulatory protein